MRFGKFNLVGLLGAALQLILICLLTKRVGLPTAAATLIAVELTLLHNFFWHQRFTWRDRKPTGFRQAGSRLWRFHAANGAISLCGNMLLMYCFVERLKIPVAPATIGAIALCALVNFRLADRWVYASGAAAGECAKKTA
jgi:putative flippase GtrA